MAAVSGKEHYHALVDMGSNGIRFSISDLSPPRARNLPTIYQDRYDVSLYDAQYDGDTRIPIPQAIINGVLDALRQFLQTCLDFQVPKDRVRIVATEATRTAINSVEFLDQIYSGVGVKVEMLAKEEEGRIGALGIASSFDHVKGLVLDLGGGSVQLTWLETDNGMVKMGTKGSISLPYGAAALTKMLELNQSDENHRLLEQRLFSEITKAFQDLGLAQLLEEQHESLSEINIFLSGGGFRGWGYILMSEHFIQPYPIPLINGFSVGSHSFQASNVSGLSQVDNSTFRISSRRSSQVPAISLLVTAVTSALPTSLKSYKVHFAQGGVREGLLFSTLPPSVRSTNPLVSATSPFAPRDTSALLNLVNAALPTEAALSPSTSPFSESVLVCAVHLLHVHSSHPKDIRASSALRCTTTGLLADAHGISHQDRAILALILCERWGAEVAPTDHEFQLGLQRLIGAETAFWAMYLGRILHGLGNLFPAGVVREGMLRVHSNWGIIEGGKKHGEHALMVEIQCKDSNIKLVEEWARDVGKLGKKKHWIYNAGSDSPKGFKIQCRAAEMPDPH